MDIQSTTYIPSLTQTHSSSNVTTEKSMSTYIVLFSLVDRLLVAVAAGHTKHPGETAALGRDQASL